MGKIVETIIDEFDGGWNNDPRNGVKNKASAMGHFDTRTRPNRLTPYRGMESGDSDALNNFITQFLAYNNKLYGFGTASGATSHKIWERSDFTGNTWTAFAAATAGTRYPYVFIEQGSAAFVWDTATPDLLNTDLDGAASLGATFVAGTFSGATFFGQPCVHSKDKKVYLPYDNKIARVDYGVLNESAVLTLPSSQQIVCVSEYGNYLAIGARPATNRLGEGSVVYLWDRDSSLATVSEIIDAGSEALQIVDVVDGELITISVNINVTSANLFPKIVFRRFNGSTLEVFQEIQCSAIVPSQVIQRQRYNGRLYFNFIGAIEGTTYAGIWSIGRSRPGQPLTVTLDYIPDPNGTVDTIYGFKHINDYLFVSTNRSATEAMWKTNDASSYTTTSFYDTSVIKGSSQSIKKKLLGVTVAHPPLPAAGQIVLKYKKDADSSFTTIFTHTTDDSISHSAINIESSGANLPEFKEIRFRVESTGGAEVTEISCKHEETNRDGAYD